MQYIDYMIITDQMDCNYISHQKDNTGDKAL